MRVRNLLTLTVLAGAIALLPSMAAAQTTTPGRCDATNTGGLAGAPGCALTNDLTSTVTRVLRLYVADAAAPTTGADAASAGTDLGTPDATHYLAYNSGTWQAGWLKAQGPAITAVANVKAWVSVKATTWEFKTSTTDNNNCWNNDASCSASAFGAIAGKSLGDLVFQTTATNVDPVNAGTWTPISTTDQAVGIGATGAGNGVRGVNTRYMWYQSGWNPSQDTPGQYRITLTYTITAN